MHEKKQTFLQKNKPWIIGFIMGLLLGFLAVSFFAEASRPDYSVSYALKSEVRVNDTTLGHLVIKEEPYIADNIIITNFSDRTAQRYDKFINNLPNSLLIERQGAFYTIVVPGESFIIDQTGDFFIKQNTNATNNFTLAVGVEPAQTITIEMAPPPILESTTSQSNFTLDGEHIVELLVDIDEDAEPKDYTYTVNTRNGHKNISKNVSLKLLESRGWSLISESVNDSIEVEAGQTLPVGNVRLLNTGNANFQVTTEVTGAAKNFVQVQQSLTLFKKTETTFNINVAVPSLTVDGKYNATVWFRGGESEASVNFTIVVKDTEAPVINEINFSEPYVFRDNFLTVIASDNIGIDIATVSFLNQTHNMTRDANLWGFHTQINQTTPISFVFCVTDTNNNSACLERVRSFDRLLPLEYKNRIDAPTKKQQTFTEVLLFNATEPFPGTINITLTDLVAELDEGYFDSFLIRVVNPDEEEKRFESINQTITISKPGPTYLQIRSENPTTWEALFDLQAGSLIEPLTDILVSGKHATYELPEAFSRPWVGGTLECEPIDTGDLETSQLKCTTYHEVGTDLSKLTLPITQAEFDSELANKELLEEQHTKALNFQRGMTIAAIGLFAFALLFSIYAVKFDPIFRWRMK